MHILCFWLLSLDKCCEIHPYCHVCWYIGEWAALLWLGTATTVTPTPIRHLCCCCFHSPKAQLLLPYQITCNDSPLPTKGSPSSYACFRSIPLPLLYCLFLFSCQNTSWLSKPSSHNISFVKLSLTSQCPRHFAALGVKINSQQNRSPSWTYRECSLPWTYLMSGEPPRFHDPPAGGKGGL